MADRALVTGANGFVGSAICHSWVQAGGIVRGSMRNPAGRDSGLGPGIEIVDETLPAQAKCRDVDVVIHCAARAHVLLERSADPLAEFRRVNRDATVSLAVAAAAAHVRRFIFISSIGVVGNRSFGTPLRETDEPRPQEDYAISKWEAEQGLERIARETGMEVTVLRMPLIYGPNPKGNLAKLLAAVERHRILPLGLVKNRRSFLGLSNLCDAILVAARMPESGYRTYHLADPGTVSVRRMVQLFAEGLGVSLWLAPLPRWMAVAAGSIFGHSATVRRLFDDLEVDGTAFAAATGWTPHQRLEEGLKQMARAWAASRQSVVRP